MKYNTNLVRINTHTCHIMCMLCYTCTNVLIIMVY